MLNFNSIILFTEDPKSLTEFYKKVFDKKPDMEMENFYGFIAGTTFLSIGPHDKVHGKSQNPERIMMNFETTDVKGEFERVKSAGATVIAEPYQMGEGADAAWIATFADPDGNYFQLVTPWKDQK
jgi:predicted enzyme related to lactoylglutathione lyase